MVRCILKLGPISSFGYNEVATLKMLNLENRVKQLKVKHAFNIFHNKCPSYLSTHLMRQHTHTISSDMNLYIPYVKGIESSAFFYKAAK